MAFPATKAIELTTDSESLNGQLCPEVAVWTCSLMATDPVIRYSLKRGNKSVQIDGHNHPTGFELQYTDSLFISKGEYTLSEPAEDLSENITRTLTVNNEELYNLGYRYIGCETFQINTTTPLDLDIEGKVNITFHYNDLFFIVPTRPEVMSTNLLLNTTSSLASVQIRTSSIVNIQFISINYLMNISILHRYIIHQGASTGRTLTS